MNNKKLHWFNICLTNSTQIGSFQVGYNSKLVTLKRLQYLRKMNDMENSTVTAVTYLGYMRPELMKFIKENENV